MKDDKQSGNIDTDRKYQMDLKEAEDRIEEICSKRIGELYGERVPEPVSKRLKQELTTISNNGFAAEYCVAYEIARESKAQGAPVQTNGQMAASFVMYLLGVTDIDPLPQHYYCTECGFYEEVAVSDYGCVAFDLEDKACPNCGALLIKDGHNIPFEVYLGIHLNRRPAVDIRVAPEVQAQMTDLAELCEPDDALGSIRDLAARTGVTYGSIPMSDPDTVDLLLSGDTDGVPVFEDAKARELLELAKGDEGNDISSFGTLMRILALSGAGEWTDDARRERLISEGKLDQVIVYRDEVFADLLGHGASREDAERIAEWVRKGVFKERVQDTSRSEIEWLRQSGIDEEYIKSLESIAYLQSKPWVLSEMMKVWRIAYYKAHFREKYHEEI